MTLDDLTLPVPYAECRDLALVYDYEAAAQWYAIQQEHGDSRHVATGLQLSDGRWMMRGDILSELHPGGIMSWASQHLTAELKGRVSVLPLSDIVALLPVE